LVQRFFCWGSSYWSSSTPRAVHFGSSVNSLDGLVEGGDRRSTRTWRRPRALNRSRQVSSRQASSRTVASRQVSSRTVANGKMANCG